jgi:hypothetical protein
VSALNRQIQAPDGARINHMKSFLASLHIGA